MHSCNAWTMFKRESVNTHASNEVISTSVVVVRTTCTCGIDGYYTQLLVFAVITKLCCCIVLSFPQRQGSSKRSSNKPHVPKNRLMHHKKPRQESDMNSNCYNLPGCSCTVLHIP